MNEHVLNRFDVVSVPIAGSNAKDCKHNSSARAALSFSWNSADQWLPFNWFRFDGTYPFSVSLITPDDAGTGSGEQPLEFIGGYVGHFGNLRLNDNGLTGL